LDGFLLAEQTIWEGLAAYAAADGAQLLEIEGTRAVITGSSYEAFNAVFSVDPAPLAAIEKLVGLCRDAGAPVLWHIWPRAGEQLERRLLERGLVFHEEEPAMLADLTLETGFIAPPQLAVTRIETAAELEAWVRLLSGSDDIGSSATSAACAPRPGTASAQRLSTCSAGSTARRSRLPQCSMAGAPARSSTS
jgi:hypothetical protein